MKYEATVKLLTSAKNGANSPFLAGTISLDWAVKVIAHHDRRRQPERLPKLLTGKAEALAGAASVRLGLGGLWEPGKTAADYAMPFEKGSLQEE